MGALGQVRERLRSVEVDQIPEHGEKASAWVSPQAYPAPLKWDMHQAFEIVLGLSGEQERYFDDVALTLGPGDVVLSAAWEPHGWQTTAPETVLVVIFFVPQFLGDESLGEVPWLSLLAASPSERPRVTSEEMRRRILGIASELRQEIEEQEQGWDVVLRLGVLRLLFTISRRWRPPEATQGQSAVPTNLLARIAPAVNLVHVRRGHRVGVGEGATACSLSPSRFSAIFRQTMGVSFGKYVLRCRAGYGAELLLAADAPLAVIAKDLGFADASHFHHAFAKVYGCSPDEYRDGRCR